MKASEHQAAAAAMRAKVGRQSRAQAEPRVNAAQPPTPPPRSEPVFAPRLTEASAASDGQSTLLSHLLKIESDARRAGSERELLYLMVNETRALVRARQVFMVRRPRAGHGCQVAAVSVFAAVDRQVPLVRWVENLIARLAATDGIERSREFTLPAYTDPSDGVASMYPFANMLWLPLWSRGSAVADGLLLARETPWLNLIVE